MSATSARNIAVLCLIAYGMWLTQSAWPLVGLIVLTAI